MHRVLGIGGEQVALETTGRVEDEESQWGRQGTQPFGGSRDVGGQQ
ncbi:MAG: hypothetical protein H0V71_06445 [Chloroflexi bacterium]|nr:hypothetical protein [Chloroflexota bacterium]